ncbi:MAG: FAD-dependent oxidoreductase [Limnochordia bacterium]
MLTVDMVHRTDVLVCGATSGAVAAALAAKKQGVSVMVVSDRSYFGEETAGAMRLWQHGRSDDPLYRGIFGEGGPVQPPTPGHVKRILDTALLRAEIPFLFESRPVFLLRDEDGQVAGVVLASRTALYGVRCRAAVDASRTGVLTRVAGLPLRRVKVPAVRELVVVGATPPEGSPFTWQEAESPFSVTSDDKTRLFPAYRLRLPLSQARDSLTLQLSADHGDRARAHYPGILYSADTFTDALDERLGVEADLRNDLHLLADHELVHLNGRLIVANALLPLSASGASCLDDLAGQLALGHRAGLLASEYAAGLPVVEGPLACHAGAQGRTDGLRFAERLRRPREGTEAEQVGIHGVPVFDACDVLVAGGGTAGAPAGIGAARSGARTVVLERLHGLGGVGTLGLITHYWYGNRVGFTAEMDAGVEACAKEAPERPGRWNPEEKMGWYLRALRDAGASAWLGSFAFGAEMDGSQVTGVLVSTPYGTGMVRAGAVVDATGNADVAAAAGAPCRVIDHRHVAVQGAGLSSRRPGIYYRNSDHAFIDDTDALGVTHAYVNARAKFAQEFDVAVIVGSRERRQVIGEHEISPLDLLAKRTYPDTIVIARSNFDTHGYTVHPVFMVVPPDQQALMAHVPFRCLVPQGVDRVLVTGLGVSAHRDALPVIRMQPDVQNQGYAAGLAASMAAKARSGFQNIDVRKLQKELVDEGILDAEVLRHTDSFPLAAEVVREAAVRGPSDLFTAAIIMGYPEVSTPILLEILQRGADEKQREDAALILGLSGRVEAVASLVEMIDSREWDEGWDYTGMGQFGRSMSRLDALIIALGKTGDPAAISTILRKIQTLDERSAFSHCRAVSVAASAFTNSGLAEALYALLQKPGMQGHAHLRTAQVIADVNDSPVETEARNQSLKELVLGRGLYLCGDHEGLGRHILETYADDLRGHYARHAQAILGHADLESLRAEVM